MYNEFINPISTILSDKGIQKEIELESPPSTDLGDFCIVVNKIVGKANPIELANNLQIEFNKIDGIQNVEIYNTDPKGKKGIIFLNFKIEKKAKKRILIKFVNEIIKEVNSDNYSYLTVNKGKIAVVEHTSANPISPIHVGNLRNSIQGDTFARILERSGYKVKKIFYVNDVGLQISTVIIGYEIIKNNNIKPIIKIDHWSGQLYAIMNCLYSIQNIKEKAKNDHGLTLSKGYEIKPKDVKELTKVINIEISDLKSEEKNLSNTEKISKEQKNQLRELKKKIKKLEGNKNEITKYKDTFEDLKLRFPDLFETLFNEVSKFDLNQRTSKYLLAYEQNSDPYITQLFKELTTWVLKGFEWTLNRYNIKFDKFDYESEVTWSGKPNEVIEKLSQSNKAKIEGKAIRYSYPTNAMNQMIKELNLSKTDIPIKGNVPDLQLRRSDGSALYAAKDIAYSMKKFEDNNPDIIYNVISTEQSLPQFQLLLPLYELGFKDYASKLKHYGYELVDLAGRPMSGRLASYVTADEFYDETFIRSRLAKRMSDAKRDLQPPSKKEEWDKENKILKSVTLASTRYPLLDKSPTRHITLDVDRELDFKRNPGPFIQYAHARACGILNSVKSTLNIEPEIDIDYSLLIEDDIIEILKHLKSLSKEIINSIITRDPSLIATWCFNLAQMFMKFYEQYPVIKAETNELLKARLLIIYLIRKAIFNGLDILGIPATEEL